jgi:ribonuclease P protein component
MTDRPALTLLRLPNRADFLRANGGARAPASAFVLLGIASAKAAADACRVGFTATKKLGNAVVRNRARRRLREAVRASFPAHAAGGHDYVVIARPGALTQDFPRLVEDLKQALAKTRRAKPKTSPPAEPES